MIDKINQFTELAKDQLQNITVDNLFAWTVGTRLFDLSELVPQVRSVAWLGYGSILAQLTAILMFEFAGTSESIDALVSPGITLREPVFVLLITSAGFLFGWAFMLTGMLFTRARNAVPLYVVFVIQIIIFASGSAIYALGLATLVGISLIIARVNESLRNWNNLALVGLIVSTSLLGGFGYIVWSRIPNINSFAGSLNGTMQFVGIFAYALWFAMGCGVIVTSVRVSIFVVQNLRRIVSGKGWQWFVCLVLLIQTIGEFIFGILNRDPAWITNGSLTMFLVLAALGLWLGRRWDDRTASILFGISVTTFVFASSLSVIFADLMHRKTLTAGFFSPALVFLLVAADNLLRFGKPIKAGAKRLGSQAAWVLIYFGLIMTVISALTLLLTYQSAVTGQPTRQVQNALSGLTLGAMSVSGPLYLLWVLLRRRQWWDNCPTRASIQTSVKNETDIESTAKSLNQK